MEKPNVEKEDELYSREILDSLIETIDEALDLFDTLGTNEYSCASEVVYYAGIYRETLRTRFINIKHRYGL